MNINGSRERERRAALHAALADSTRLHIVDLLAVGDSSLSELSSRLGVPTNLLAHHVKTLEGVGLVVRRRSEGDGRRTYLRLIPAVLEQAGPGMAAAPSRVVFICTANSARSHLAAALWSRTSDIPATSAGTHPGDRIDPGALATATRHDLPLPRLRPRHLDDVVTEGDLVITVCDLAHEELHGRAPIHWSVPDPVREGTDAAFDAAFEDLETRVHSLVPRYRPGNGTDADSTPSDPAEARR